MTVDDGTRIPGFTQRWRERREWRVPARGVIVPERYRVDVMERPPANGMTRSARRNIRVEARNALPYPKHIGGEVDHP